MSDVATAPQARVSSRTRSLPPQSLYFLIPFAVFVVHSSLWWGWIIDDAGISFAYARNLAHGYGLVAQPGAAPVEGYSNFLWVVVMAPFFATHLFDPQITPKLLSVALVFGSFAALFRTLLDVSPRGEGTVDRRPMWAGLTLLLLALNTPFVVWTTSGLENPLLVFLLCLLLYLSLRSISSGSFTVRGGVALGAIVAAVAMTRPDGVLFAVAYPAAVVAVMLLARPAVRLRPGAGHAAAYGATFVLAYGAFLLHRLLCFGELQANTYYAKGGPSLADMKGFLTLQPAQLNRGGDLVNSLLGGPLHVVALLLLLALGAYVLRTRRLAHVVLLVFVVVAGLVVLLLPGDWMGENRFCTPFVLFVYALAGQVAATLMPRDGEQTRRLLFAGAVAVFLVASSGQFAVRSVEYLRHPAISFRTVTELEAYRYNRDADLLGVEQGSVLLNNAGGTLYYSRLHILDLPGLVDARISRMDRRDADVFREFVFGEAKPTFINLHSVFASSANLDRDPRLRQDYVLLCGSFDIDGSGYYAVRKDAVYDDSVLVVMRNDCPKQRTRE